MDIKIKVGIIITNEEKRILLIKETLPKKGVPLWNIIKGTYGDRMHESIFDAAMRECREEASVPVELIGALGTYISEEKGKIRIQCNFCAHIKSGAPAIPKKEEQEAEREMITEVRWFTKNEIQKMSASDFVSPLTYSLLLDFMAGKQYPLEIYSYTFL